MDLKSEWWYHVMFYFTRDFDGEVQRLTRAATTRACQQSNVAVKQDNNHLWTFNSYGECRTKFHVGSMNAAIVLSILRFEFYTLTEFWFCHRLSLIVYYASPLPIRSIVSIVVSPLGTLSAVHTPHTSTPIPCSVDLKLISFHHLTVYHSRL